MIALEQTLATLAYRKRAAVSALNCFLMWQPYRYLMYRLRYVIARILIDCITHVVEFYLILHFLNRHNAFFIILLRIVSHMASGAWWGILECMREKIRLLMQQRQKDKVALLIKQWINLALIICGLIIGLLIVPLFKSTSLLTTWYIIAIGLQLQIRLISQTLHSGAFAFTRIYRPFYSMLLPDAASLFSLLITLPLLHAASLPFASFSSALISLWISIHFSQRMLDTHRIHPFKYNKHTRLKAALDSLRFNCIQSTLGGLLLKTEGFLMLFLACRSLHQAQKSLHFSYLLLPLIAASFNWSKTFYFDYKKLTHPIFKNISKRFHRYLELVPFIISLPLTLFACLCITLFYPTPGLSLALSLYLYFTACTLLSLIQIQAFAGRCFLQTIVISSAAILTLLALKGIISNYTDVFLLLACIHIIEIIILKITTFKHHCIIINEGYVSPWFAQSTQSVREITLVNTTLTEARDIATKLNQHADNTVSAIALDATTIYYRAQSAHVIELTHVFCNGKFLCDERVLPPRPQPALSKSMLVQQFIRQFPTGIIVDYSGAYSRNTNLLTSSNLTPIWRNLDYFLRHPFAIPHHGPHVFALCEETLSLIFVVFRCAQQSHHVAIWQYRLHLMSLDKKLDIHIANASQLV
ncbi:MAG: hypothetical protein COB66_01785 [Coxiella sp. (in: Bacteria)]|nr:MAG: hypothetical protein COB66_01785 [Coxiella sp. (in: g-proteobacteria)]